jgi:carbonic anhydrase
MTTATTPATPSNARRGFFRSACCGTLAAASAVALPAFGADAVPKSSMTPDQALARLKAGNADFLAGKRKPSQLDNDRRLEIARSQAPFAVLVGCSDSRVPPELLFGVGLGELFIVRNAGNTVDTTALGSVEYGAMVLGAPLVVVLGHERCGAVEAAVSVVEKNAVYPGSIGKMIEGIIPAALIARSTGNLKGDALLDAAVRENVKRTVERLRTTETMFQEPQKSGKLKIVGARYDLDTGEVEFFA